MSKPKWWARRRLIIDDLQYRLLFTNLAYFLVGTAIVGAVVFVPLIAQVQDLSLPAVQRGLVAGELLSLHRRFWPGLLLAAALLSLHSVLTSHRIAGPLYRFRKVMQGVGAGDLEQHVRLRRHDFLVDEATALNDMLAALRAREARIREQGERLREAALRIEGDAAGDSRLDGAMARLHAELAALDALVARPAAGSAHDDGDNATAAESPAGGANGATDPVTGAAGAGAPDSRGNGEPTAPAAAPEAEDIPRGSR